MLRLLLSPDLVDAERINVLERWDAEEALAAFRAGDTPDPGVADLVLDAEVVKYDVRALQRTVIRRRRAGADGR